MHLWTLYAREPGDLSSTRHWRVGQGRPVAYNPDKYTAEKLDIGVVPVKVPNKVGKPTAEVLEERPDGQGEFWKNRL